MEWFKKLFINEAKAALNSKGAVSGGNAGFVVQDTAPEVSSVLWVDPSDNAADDHINSLINSALGVIENGTY